MTTDLKGRFDPLGPVFVSYRTSDGAELAGTLARALWATGVPVWLDRADLPPGDTELRLEEALAGGLSGAVILVTPEVELSEFVRFVEVTQLLQLEQLEPRFSLAIASTIAEAGESGHGHLDHGAPDRLLGQRPGTLSRLKQYRCISDQDAAEVAAAMAMRRMSLVRESGSSRLEVDIQTRESAGAWRSTAALVVRLPPPQGAQRVPSPPTWEAFKPFLSSLPGLLGEAGVGLVHFRGGAHLSAAVALGVSVPVTTTWRVSAAGSSGELWEDGAAGTSAEISRKPTELGPAGHLAVMVDCVPGDALDTFRHLLAQLGDDLCASLVLRAGRNGLLRPEDGAATASALAQLIRDEAARTGTTIVHLAIRAPFPLALMLGRRLNTLELVLYEWEVGPTYVPTLTVASGRGSPVLEVHQSRPPSGAE
jgi:hypothetical protein